jgi:hypothetical protein
MFVESISAESLQEKGYISQYLPDIKNEAYVLISISYWLIELSLDFLLII